MIKKNIPKIIAALITLALLSVPIYKNYIYYLIPYNPIDEYYHTGHPYYVSSLIDTTKNHILISTSKYKTEKNNKIILEYLKNLNLIPLSYKDYEKEIKLLKNDDRIGFHLSLTDYNPFSIYELFFDNPTFFRIRSDIEGFPNGYYKIIDDEFDYNYIIDLIKGDKYLYY